MADLDDTELERLAQEELLKEAKRGKARAETMGPMGWSVCITSSLRGVALDFEDLCKEKLDVDKLPWPEKVKHESYPVSKFLYLVSAAKDELHRESRQEGKESDYYKKNSGRDHPKGESSIKYHESRKRHRTSHHEKDDHRHRYQSSDNYRRHREKSSHSKSDNHHRNRERKHSNS